MNLSPAPEVTRAERKKHEYLLLCYVQFYDDGRVIAAITSTVQAENQPQDERHHGRLADIYTDWFPTLEQAQAYVNEAKEA